MLAKLILVIQMALDNKTDSIFRKMGLIACSGLLALNMACTKHESMNKNSDHTTLHNQKHVLQPVDFDVLDQYRRVFAQYRNVTYAQSKNLTVDVPENGEIVLKNIQRFEGFEEDLLVYDNGLVVGGHAFRNKFDFEGTGFKPGKDLESIFQDILSKNI